MTTRSLTEVFILMRNNAIRNRHIYSEQDNSERMALVALHDIERGSDSYGDSRMPPSWTDQLEEVQFIMTKLDGKINELKTLHSRHLHRPTLDESSEEEQLIERLTGDVTLMFNSAHRLILHIKYRSTEGNIKQQRLTTNIVKSLTCKLQELSIQFRTYQSNYLKQIKSREERSNMFFDDPNLTSEFDLIDTKDPIDETFVNNRQQMMTQQQLLILEEENTIMAAQREQEVNNIVKSIVDLNDIFKDLARMVEDQGTILDRIDYNIEQTQTQVYEGYKQLQKAETYQRKNRKMCCILILAASIVLLILLLIIFKT